MNKKMIGALLGTLAIGSMNMAYAGEDAKAEKPKAEKGKKGDKKAEGDKKGGEKACGGEKGCGGAKK